jgi:hypothetical protein
MSEEEEIKIELPRRWREIDEANKAEYIIRVVDFDEKAGIITKLRLSRIHRPLGFNVGNRIELNYDVDYEGSEITVAITKIKYSWDGTGTETVGIIKVKEGHVEEDPWFVDPEEIDDTVERLGVAKTCKLILDCIKDLADYYLTWEE